MINNQEDVVAEFVRYFETLLGGERRERELNIEHLRSRATHVLTEEERDMLVSPVTRDEVKEAFFDIEEDKALAPDGYSAGFYKAAWPIVGREVTDAILEFFHNGRLLKQINSTVISLIPKVHTPLSVSNFRPISYCNVLYKVITKILVKRIRLVLEKLISPTQNAFVSGRSIGDNVLMAQELFSGYNQQRKPPRCALKVDLHKDYDMMEWDFLFAVLQLYKFSEPFIGWIRECVTTTTFTITLNGGIHGFFTGARGLRQGDPMSPYLFVLVMKILGLMIQQKIEVQGGFLYHWRCEETRLFQLSFADDLLLFCRADETSI
ncbi:UNVERIFIED_CONTAM: hypothetical protein Sindi_1435000 [Sesamum indicum]